jgi:hypothetical protein
MHCIGVGQASPGAKLDVNGGALFAGDITNSAGKFYVVNTYGYFFGGSGNLTGWQGSNGTQIIQGFTGGTERLRITSAGLVGIGTSSPAYKLDVVVASSKGIGAFAPASSAGITDFSAGGVGWTFTRPDDGSYIHSIYSYNTAAAAKNNFVIQSRNDIVFTYGGDHTNAIETMRLADGKVGIGTASPGAELDVRGGANVGDGITTVRTVASGGVGFVGTSTNHPLSFRINNTERARIDSSGNVGIGVSTVGFGAVDHGVHIYGSGAQEGIRLETTNGSAGILEIYAESGGSTLDTRGSGYIRFNSAATEWGRWDSSGRLLVGTSS